MKRKDIYPLIELDFFLRRAAAELHDTKFDPGEPRVPAGSSGGGQWTDGSGGGLDEGIANPTWSPFDFIGGLAGGLEDIIAGTFGRELEETSLTDYLSQTSRLPMGVFETGSDTSLLTSEQLSSLKRFQGKGDGFENAAVSNLSDSSAIFSVKIPADNIPGSYALWEKYVDPDGTAIKVNKIVIGPDGELVHIKPK